MSSHTYRLEAGRCIMRDNKPFVTIHRAQSATGAEYIEPSDVDNFAHVCTAAMALLDACKQAAFVLKECGYRFPITEEVFDDTLKKCIDAIEKTEHPYE